MCALLTGAVLNIVLDPIFIYVLNLGVVYLCYVFRKKSVFNFKIKDCCFSKKIMSEIMKIGIPTLVFQLLTSLSIALINKQTKVYGDSVMLLWAWSQELFLWEVSWSSDLSKAFSRLQDSAMVQKNITAYMKRSRHLSYGPQSSVLSSEQLPLYFLHPLYQDLQQAI